ncbi:MAG: hypothetical protein K2N69_01410, partial [Helicobacter sp.]|nr:hypothetical protein [Helicobacter sp.]
ARTLPLCAVVGTLRLKSNGESKIAIFKAALCYGFAIALRALFLGILPYSPSLAEGVRGWVVMLRRSRNILSLRASKASAAINKQGIPIRWIATRLKPLAMTNIIIASHPPYNSA